MTDSVAKKLIIAAALLVVAAVVFAGAIVWQSRGSTIPKLPAPAVSTQKESSIPHYVAGNINGTIASIGQNSITLTVPPLMGSTMSTTSVTVTIDSDTEIYKIGTPIDPQIYQQEEANYLTQRESNPNLIGPDPYTHVAVPFSSLTVGTAINILPKLNTVQGTTLHARTIVIQ